MLQQARADTLYRELAERMDAADTLKNHAFAERFSRKEALRDWQVLTRLFMWLMARIVAEPHGPEVFAGEQSVLERLRHKKSVDGWLELCESAGRVFADTDHLHLDKKQALLMLLRATGE